MSALAGAAVAASYITIATAAPSLATFPESFIGLLLFVVVFTRQKIVIAMPISQGTARARRVMFRTGLYRFVANALIAADLVAAMNGE